MAESKLTPLQYNVSIVNTDGTPTPYFIQLLQQLYEEKAITDAAVAHNIVAGAGLSGGGSLDTGDVTLNANVQAILDLVSTTRGAILYRGASAWSALLPGTAGKVLQTNGAGADPSWATAAAGGGSYVLLEQHTAANSATIDFTTGITATYDDFEFEFIQLAPTLNATTNFWMRFSTNGGTSYDASTIYDYSNNFWGSTNFNANNGAENQAQAVLNSFTPGNAAGYSSSGSLKLFNPASITAYKQFNFHVAGSASDAHFYNTLGAGRYKSLTAVNAVRFMCASGNFASGIIRLYGRAKV